MMLAQRLYEGVELGKEGAVGLITYMRTDSTRVSNDALTEVRELIGQRYGAKYLPEKPIVYKSKKDAQDAHEAIRPTSVRAHARRAWRQYLAEDELKLYRLIWKRFVASQMSPALFDQTTIEVDRTRQGRRELPVPRDRVGTEVRRLPGGLRGRQGPEGRGRRRASTTSCRR